MELGEMMENPLTPLFHFDYDFYCEDQLVKKKFEQKFIDHYFFYEIGCETHARWSQMLKARLNLIMPYYKQLYETELKSKNIEFLLNKDYTETFIRELDRTKRWSQMLKARLNLIMPYYKQLYETELKSKNIEFLLNKDYTETFIRELDRTNRDEVSSQVTGETTLTNQGETTSNTNSEYTSSSQQNEQSSQLQNGKRSSINDGVSSASLSEGYLTEVTQTKQDNQGQSTSSESHSQSSSTTASSNDVSQSNSTNHQNTLSNGESGERESHTIIGKGNIGTTSSAELLSKWRGVLINIDQLIINECKDLFMLIY